jgi:hypothetical protein
MDFPSCANNALAVMDRAFNGESNLDIGHCHLAVIDLSCLQAWLELSFGGGVVLAGDQTYVLFPRFHLGVCIGVRVHTLAIDHE